MRICDILVSTFQQYPSGSQNDVVVAAVLAQVVVTTRFTPLVSAAVSVILVGAMPWPVAQRTEKEGQNPDGGADADEGADNGNPSKKQRMEATATACACDCLVANNRIELVPEADRNPGEWIRCRCRRCRDANGKPQPCRVDFHVTMIFWGCEDVEIVSCIKGTPVPHFIGTYPLVACLGCFS